MMQNHLVYNTKNHLRAPVNMKKIKTKLMMYNETERIRNKTKLVLKPNLYYSHINCTSLNYNTKTRNINYNNYNITSYSVNKNNTRSKIRLDNTSNSSSSHSNITYSKYPFLNKKNIKLKYLVQKDIDCVLNINTNQLTEIPKENSKRSEVNSTIQNVSHITTDETIVNKIENKELSKLLSNLIKHKHKNILRKTVTYISKKVPITERFRAKLKNPLLPNDTTHIFSEDKYTKFRLLLNRQKDKNQKLLNDLKEAAVINDALLKGYVVKLLRNKNK